MTEGKLHSLSPRYSERIMNSHIFQELNQRYFAGRLPRYQVVSAPHLRHATGRIARRSRRIYLQPAPPDLLLRILLHEMAHAATNDRHGPIWLAEMRRLWTLGAPVEDPSDYEARIPLTRQLVFETGYEAFWNEPTLTDVQIARWLQHEYGFVDGRSLLRAYPWVRRVLQEARQEAAEHRQLRERQLAAQTTTFAEESKP
jgi:SprT-like family protein